MASREKKTTASKKQTTDDSSADSNISQNDNTDKIVKRRKINPAKKVTKRVGKLGLSLKAKDKKPRLTKKIVKVILKATDIKKNGMTLPAKRIVKKKFDPDSISTEQVSVERKTKKNSIVSATSKPIKTDNSESLSKIDATIDSILKKIQLDEKTSKPKKPRIKKPKVTEAEVPPLKCDTVSETIEQVMKDLTSLLKCEEITSKPAVLKKPKEKLLKCVVALEDNIIIDASAQHLIDMLDLSVSKNPKLTTSPEKCIRRHSIEKLTDSKNSPLISNISRTTLSKISRTSKIRSSVDCVLRRFSPYNTRSDSPAQKLRNGKPRAMKENLLEGMVESRKRRKRLSSDYSGEKCKLSGYESDSSNFSDLSANVDVKKAPTINGVEDETITDDNSNVCSNFNNSTDERSAILPCPKVPEKSILIDIMKQAFSDINIDQESSAIISEASIVPTELFTNITPKMEETTTGNCEELTYTAKVNEQQENIEAVEPKEEASLQSPKPNAQFAIEEAILQSKVDAIIKSMESDDFIQPQNVDTVKDAEIIKDIKIEPEIEQSSIEDENLNNLAAKESILQALGLQSLKAVEEAKLKDKLNKSDYTGSLKAVIKINRIDKNKRRNMLKMSNYKYEVDLSDQTQKMKENSSSNVWKIQNQSAQSSDTAGAPRKSHSSNRINMDGSSEQNSDVDMVTTENDDPYKVLVIPEKASSFSIHPGRLCKDECTYCFGKFGLFDTPCHIAQMKSVERQDKILETERHLTRDSCLCDACYRHVDRKSNTPSYLNKGSKRNSIIAPGPRQNHCHVLSCTNIATHILRRKWIMKMRKSVCKVINIDLDNPGLHSIPICEEHYLAVEHLMICVMCKRRLTRNQIHYLGPETSDLNIALNAMGIPVKLFDKPVVCKLCRYFSTLMLRPTENMPENTNNFYKDYRKRLLHFHNIEVMEEADEEEESPTKDKPEKDAAPTKKRKRLHKSTNNIGPPVLEPQVDLDKLEQSRSAPSDSNSTGKSRSESPSDYMVDYNTLIPSIAMECGSDAETSKKTQLTKKPLKLPSNANISVRELFPGEDELGLQCQIDFGKTKEKTVEGWEKCNTVIQYDNETKLLWQELQKPYGNQSSFLRHLVLLEKYFRNGDLILAPNASHHSVNYSESVQNRLRAYDNVPKAACSQINHSPASKDSSIINAANIPKNTPITITQINNITKTRVPPPGLISLNTAATRPKTPAATKAPHTNKIKIPLTKNWRPTLIPIDPNNKSEKDKKPGYVKVVSNSKPYHITLDDYNRMCAIKKSYDLKQKRLLEAAQSTKTSLTKNVAVRGKGLVIKKPSPVKADSELENYTETSSENQESKSSMSLPKIPKSLTVIPQTVRQSPPPTTVNACANKS